MKYIIDLPDGLGEGLMALVTGSNGMCMTRVERPASCWISVSIKKLKKKLGYKGCCNCVHNYCRYTDGQLHFICPKWERVKP